MGKETKSLSDLEFVFVRRGRGAGELLVGAASADITPNEPVALDGQFRLRISQGADTPITANVIALESRTRSFARRGDHGLLRIGGDYRLSPEIVRGVEETAAGFRPEEVVPERHPHAHRAPHPARRVPRPQAGRNAGRGLLRFAASASPRPSKRHGRAESRAASPGARPCRGGLQSPGRLRRRTRKCTAPPTGRTSAGWKATRITTWARCSFGMSGKLIAIVVDVSCPAQEVENINDLNADFWYPVRESLRKRYGSGVCVLGWTGAAGDQSPHLMYRRGRRTDAAIAEADPPGGDLPTHRGRRGRDLRGGQERPARPRAFDPQSADAPTAHAAGDRGGIHRGESGGRTEKRRPRGNWQHEVVERYERQQTEPQLRKATQIHVLRMGDVAICTNPFELFTDYGVQIKARSPAAQTFVVQLAGGPGPDLICPPSGPWAAAATARLCSPTRSGRRGARCSLIGPLKRSIPCGPSQTR